MANPYDQFNARSEFKDLATSFGVGSNQLLKMAGDVYGLASGNMDNAVSRQGQENIDYLQRGKSQKLIQSETRRKAAVDMEEGTLNQALAYVRETFTDPRLFLSTTAEAAPSMVGAGGIGAGARVATGKVLAKMGAEKAAETATKVGVGTAVAAGAGMQGTSVGADQYKEIVELLSNMPEDQALKVPQIVQLVVEKGATLEEAKTALALDLARSTGALAAVTSAVTQMLPGGRTIEKALVGGAGKKIAGAALTRAGVGAIGEGAQEALEEGSGAGVKNLLAQAVDPEREITKGMGEAMGAGFAGAGPIGAVAGAASRPSRPVLASETTAGMSSEPLASDAIPSETRTSTTDTPDLSLEGAAEMNTREIGSVLSARESSARGFTPDPSDIATAESVRRPQIEVSEEAAKEANAPVQEALDEWRTQNPDVGLSVTVINDPNMRNTRNYGIRGYFDPNTGEVVINSAFTKPFEVESVVNHEWSHHTLSSEDGRAALVEFATRDIPKEELDALAKRYPNADSLTLVEEWIARNQEKSPGTFARIIAKIREWLNGKLGINMTNEEVARVMLRTLRERGAPVAEGSGEMRQSTTEQPVSVSERRAEALRSFKERNPLSDATMENGRLYSPKVRDRLKTLSSTGVVDRAALDSDIETNFPAASRVEIPTEETLPTLDEIRDSFGDNEVKKSKVGGAVNIPEGDLIVVRQDVPSYTEYGLGVVTVRDSKGNTYYQPMVRFTDPVLKPTPREEMTALRIGSGEAKNPTIVVEGRMASDQSMPADLDTWTQVGYNPDRHSYMYDRETGDPVLSGSEAVQIGNTVFVKDPEFGQRKDFKYSVEDEPLDTASENLNKTPNEATSIQQDDTRPARALPKSRFYVSSDERGGDFAGAIAEAARLHKKGAAVEVKSPEFYSDPENHLYFSEDGLAGAVVKPDGDLVSVFKHPDSTAKMRDILTDASQEATKLDGFDIDEFLPNYYSRFGFRPVARVTFNDDFAPPKWNFEENGRPDNVFMVRDPENKLGLTEYDAYSEVRDSVPLVSYEEALRIQQEAVDKVASEKPKGGVLASEKPSVSEQSNVLSPSSTDTVTMKPFKYSVEDEPKAGSKKAVRTPNEAVRKLSDDYNAQMGLGPIEHGHYVNFDEATSRKIAKAYDAMPEIDRSPETVKAYEALAKEVNDQWDFAVENLGINFEPWTEDGQPYANSREMMEDVRNNNHLYFFRGGGKHEFMSQVDPETGLTSIDKLRAIHDLYGHAAEDYQFGPRGEENAWLKHSQMFSPEAQRALSVGTRGQNSWVNFGDQNYDENGVNKNIPAKDRPYAPQKMALLPEELTDWRSALGQSEPERSTVLAKQPIRESLTDDPVERVPEEGDPDYEEPVDTSSVLNAAAKRRERDDLPPTSALNTLYAIDSSIPLPAQGKRTNGQVAAQLREAAREHWGRDLDSSNITPEEIDGVVTNGVEEVLAGLKASNHAGNWYTTAIRKAMAIAGILHPELNDDALAQKAGFKDAHAAEVGLATAMAITSQNLNVQKNTQYANEQFNILKKTGRFDPSKEYGSKLEAVSGNLELANALLDRVGWDGMEDFLNKEYTVKDLNDVASKLLGRKVNISGKVDDVVNGSAIFGPKIGGGFFQNLRGNFNPVTVDLWMRRTWGRWTGDVLPDPLDAKRLARMIDGMRESGIPLPEELRSIRTIIAKSGRKVSTLSDAAAERVLSNPEAVTAAYDFAAQQDSRWNKIYSEVRQNITPEQAEAVRKGSLSLEKLNRDQQKSIREKKTAWQDLEDRPSSSSKEGKAAQEKLFAEMDKAAGRTATLTNEELSDNKPEWAKSSRVIKTLLKPVDVPSDIDRRVIVDVVNRIRNELDRQGVTATNADIQAILWYPEKDLWAKLAGKKESNLKNSYDEEFLKVAESQGLGERARAAAARVGDAAP